MTTTEHTGTPEPGYVFDNDSEHAFDQHRCLATMLDEMTIRRLRRTEIGAGWRCLEVGAGGGSVAVWLAGQVGDGGHVLATDIKPGHIPAHPNLEAIVHDIVRDPLPEATFDLIHARLVLLHLPERRQVLDRLLAALRPGGWLQLDEFDITYGPGLLMPDPRAGEVFEAFLEAKRRMFDGAGADGAWGQHAPHALQAAGFVEIDAVAEIQQWRAGSPGVALMIHHTRHLRDALVAAGMTDDELAEVRDVMSDPRFRASSSPIYSIQGRRSTTPS